MGPASHGPHHMSKMKKIVISAAVAAFAVMALAAKKNTDPVLMEVNGRPVYKSEFEYLYHKNNAQQLQPQTVDEYLKMFVDYKLKVADALANGLDTTASFVQEFNKYRDELAAPYMTDSTLYRTLLQEAYDHSRREVKVAHLMLGPAEDPAQEALADSLRQALLGGADWNEAVTKYSVDRGTNQNGGEMGWLPAGRFPWAFEKAAYDTPKGQLSPVVNSGFGYHIIRVEDERPSRGEVRASHILRLTINKSPEEQAAAKARIDSIYQVLQQPDVKFEDVARAESEDGSAANGGDLGWFGSGMMVAEFDSAAFSLPENEISKPFATRFGWHIVKNTGHRAPKSYDEMLPSLETMISNSERADLPRQSFMDSLLKQNDAAILDEGIAQVQNLIAANPGGLDSAMVEQLRVSDIPVYTIGGKQYPVSSVMADVAPARFASPADATKRVRQAADAAMRDAATDLFRQQLELENPAYRNLVNEYRDGILLFDISNRSVWDAATKDKEGLEKYFQANRAKYTWEKPKYKGFIIFAPNDSIADAALKFAQDNKLDADTKTLAEKMREKFGRRIKVERIIAAQGDNPISDYLFFNGEKPDTSKLSWPSFFGFAGHLAQQPEEVLDVRGLVTTDYQNALEKEWLERLHRQYPVKINKKVAKKLK